MSLAERVKTSVSQSMATAPDVNVAVAVAITPVEPKSGVKVIA
jgi:hypothetical protein